MVEINKKKLIVFKLPTFSIRSNQGKFTYVLEFKEKLFQCIMKHEIESSYFFGLTGTVPDHIL